MSPGRSVCYFLTLNLRAALEREVKGGSSLALEIPLGISSLWEHSRDQTRAPASFNLLSKFKTSPACGLELGTAIFLLFPEKPVLSSSLSWELQCLLALCRMEGSFLHHYPLYIRSGLELDSSEM